MTLNLTGENTLKSDSAAVIHVTGGSLAITSESEGKLIASNDVGKSMEHAAIGSNEGEDFSGSITIGGNAMVEADSDNEGAGIGAGLNGAVTGSIIMREVTPTDTLRNEARDIQTVVRGEDTPAKLIESAIGDEALALLAGDGETVLRACHLEFDEKYDGSILLTFFLNGEELGKRVEIRWLEDGEVVSRTVPVNEDGEARVTLRQLGDFVVVAK